MEIDPDLAKFVRAEGDRLVVAGSERGYLWLFFFLLGITGLAIAGLCLAIALAGGSSAWRDLRGFVAVGGLSGACLTALGIALRVPWRFEIDRSTGSVSAFRRGRPVPTEGGVEFMVFESLMPRTRQTGNRPIFNVLAIVPDGPRIPVAHSFEVSEMSRLVNVLIAATSPQPLAPRE